VTLYKSGADSRRMTASLKNALLALPGVQAVETDRNPGTVEIGYSAPEGATAPPK
jgi:hypothetical protein